MAHAMVEKNLSEANFKTARLAAEAYLDVLYVRELHRKIMNSAFVHLSEIEKI